MARTSTKEAAEAVLKELPSVVGAFVREDIYGHPREVHILVTAGPNPGHLARDVRDLLEERLGVPVDQRVISIAQLVKAPGEALPQRRVDEIQSPPVVAPQSERTDARLRLLSVHTEAGAGRVSVEVCVALGDAEHTGWSSEIESPAGRVRAGAAAALHAVTLALDGVGRLELEAAAVVEAMGREYGLVSAHAAAPVLGRQPLAVYGAHPMDPDSAEAGVYGALKAVNRIVALLLRSGATPRARRGH
jgi:hypothetical protein